MNRFSALKMMLTGLSAIVLFLLVMLVRFWISYGPVGSEKYYGQEFRQGKNYELIGVANSDNLVVIFPANSVDASQYRKFGSWISSNASVDVVIIRPTARAEVFAPKVSAVLAEFPRTKKVTFIGHSAGASTACRQQSELSIKVDVLLVGGYCRDERFRDIKTYVGVQDRFVSCAKAGRYNQGQCLNGIGHFVLTEKNFPETEKSGIMELIKDDILENLQESL